jgi:hypothetical protein
MTADEQYDATRCHRAYCHNHLRNTCIRHSLKFEAEYLKPKLAATVAEFEARCRVTGGIEGLFRAVAKEFVYCANRTYAKGHGIQFLSWCMVNYPEVVIFTLERADLGSRQDLSTEACVALLMNRKVPPPSRFLFESHLRSH